MAGSFLTFVSRDGFLIGNRMTVELPAQLRRTSISIPSNLAEGWGRRYTAGFVQFLSEANGSRMGTPGMKAISSGGTSSTWVQIAHR